MSESMTRRAPVVGVIMGSDSDLPVMTGAVEALGQFGVPHEVRILSAHRSPEATLDYATTAVGRGLKVIIAGAGGAAHLAGMIASSTSLPVIGVPVGITKLQGLDALLAIVQMPAGVPVATVAIDGSRNAGLLAVRILAVSDQRLMLALDAARVTAAQTARDKDAAVRARFSGDPSPD